LAADRLDGRSYKQAMTFLRSAFALAALALPLLAQADPPPWAGHGHGRGHEHARQEYWEGNCKIVRWWHEGQVHEQRTCRVPAPAVYVQPEPVYVQPAPIYVAPPPVVVQPAPLFVQPGVTIQGTIHLK
jgi:hypothetical protein